MLDKMEALHFAFKETRKYVHGPDIFNRMYAIASDEFPGKPDRAKLSSRKMASSHMEYSTERLTDRDVFSIFIAEKNGKTKNYYLYPSAKEIEEHINYDEKEIVKSASFDFDNKIGEIVDYTRYSVAEIAVALLKELCTKCISDAVKWIFVEFEVKKPMEEKTSVPVKIILEKNIGTKMIVSSVYIDEVKIGTMKFSST